MEISIIAAFTKQKRVIGKDGKLPWNVPEDLKRFKSLTLGHFCVVGYNTFATLPNLPGRTLIVLSKKHVVNYSNIFYTSSLDGVLNIAKSQNETELFCIGGEKTYNVFLPIATKLYISEILEEYEGDSFFPSFNASQYYLIEEIYLSNVIFKTYERKNPIKMKI